MMRGFFWIWILIITMATTGTAVLAATDPGSVGTPAETAAGRLARMYSACPGLLAGLDAYFARDYGAAAEGLESVSCADVEHGTVLAWQALSLWRGGDSHAAASVARHALALEPGCALAHYALAQACNPQFGAHGFADSDSTWAHLRQAVALDPDLADAWTMVWVEAVKRGAPAQEIAALRALNDRKLFAPGLVAMWRWTLAGLPANTLLLVNGDNDTFPTVMLQAIHEMRTDVAVVNITMLGVDAYAREICKRYDLPLPTAAGLPKGYDRHGAEATMDSRIMVRWAAAQRDGSLGRPLQVAITVPVSSLPATIRERLVLLGPTYAHVPDRIPGEVETDVEAVQGSLERLDVHAVTRSYENVHHVSPVTCSAADLAGNVVNLAHRMIYEMSGLERDAETVAAYRLMVRLVDEADLEAVYGDELQKLAAYFEDEADDTEP